MAKGHILGFPRIGENREYKKSLESYWKNEIGQHELIAAEKLITQQNWLLQKNSGLDFINAGDFSWYDHVLDTSIALGAIPQRIKTLCHDNKINDLDTSFILARGKEPGGLASQACEMTKWFNTNYHFIVPELTQHQRFSAPGSSAITTSPLIRHCKRAASIHNTKASLLGPLTFLWLSNGQGNVDKLDLIGDLVVTYQSILTELSKQNIQWVQMDEPILALDLPRQWQAAFKTVYQQIATQPSSLSVEKNATVPKACKVLLSTYFGGLGDNLLLATNLPVAGLHIDVCTSPEQLNSVNEKLSADQVLSVGLVDGRNIWKNDIAASVKKVDPIAQQRGDNLWIGTSCSLLHTPISLQREIRLDKEIKPWFSFATEKLSEISLITSLLNNSEDSFYNSEQCKHQLQKNQTAIASRKNSIVTVNPQVREHVLSEEKIDAREVEYSQRSIVQKTKLNLPLFPTTTIGSFPQTAEIRRVRKQFKEGNIDKERYQKAINGYIENSIKVQQELDLDVLVHGEPERNDMVEFFAEHLEGFAITDFGWVQSYGSRCVKPAIIYGDIYRPEDITVSTIEYAQSITDKPVKGMLTGPVTILNWTFNRDDLSKEDTAKQIAVALRGEVEALEAAGIGIIQIDEAALREGLPLRKKDWKHYLDWAARCFRITSASVKPETQIHTHMCYSDFHDIIEALVDMDADVITIENARSHDSLLHSFSEFEYPFGIGPGVYDIHSPNIPNKEDIVNIMSQTTRYIPKERLWVNPDCGLKTRNWPEVNAALSEMVAAAKELRVKYQS